MSILHLAMEYVAAGISIVPTRTDGSKRPLLSSWQRYQKRLPTMAELVSWFGKPGPAAAQVVCGAVSGGLEVLDFDHDVEAVFPAWSEMVDEVLCWCPIVETPSGGYHVFYRCCEISKSTDIATSTDGKKRVETKGEGGLIVACISDESVHPKRYPYVQTAGPTLPQIPTILPGQRRLLWEAAATFDQRNKRQAAIEQLARQKQSSKRRDQHSSDLTGRAERYVAKMPPAVSGASGHKQTFAVAMVLTHGFGLDPEQAMPILARFSDRCEPPWNSRDLEHKIKSAYNKPGERGYLL